MGPMINGGGGRAEGAERRGRAERGVPFRRRGPAAGGGGGGRARGKAEKGRSEGGGSGGAARPVRRAGEPDLQLL